MTATDATPLPARHVQRGPSSASPSTAAYPIIPARNSSSVISANASLPGTSKVRASLDLPEVRPSDVRRFKPNQRSLAKMHTTNEWVQNVTRQTETEGSPEPPKSFIGQSFDELRRKRGSTFADVGNDDDDDENEVDDADVPPDGDVLPPDFDTGSKGDELDWRPTTPLSDNDDESTRAPTDVDNDLMQKKLERAQLAAENKLISSKDFYKNARDVTQSAEAGPRSQEDGRSSPSPLGGSPAKAGKQTIKNLFMNTLTRTLRRNKSSNLRGGDDDVAATSSAPVASAPLRLESKKSIDVPRWKDDTATASTGRASPLLTMTLDRGRSRSKSRGPEPDLGAPSSEPQVPGRPSRSRSRGAAPFRSRSIGRLRPADVVAQAAAASAEPDAGSPLPPPPPTLDAVPPWNRTHEVRRELEERVGRSPIVTPRRVGTAPGAAGRRSATVRGDRGDRQRRRDNLRASLVSGSRSWDGGSEDDGDDYDRGTSAIRSSADNNTRRGGSTGGPLPSPPGAAVARNRPAPVLPVDRPLPRLPPQKVTFSPPASPTDSGVRRPVSELDGGGSSVVSGSGLGDYSSGGGVTGGRRRGSVAGSARRSALVRSHTLGAAGDRAEVEEHFVQVKALVAGGDLVAVKVSRNIPFAGLVRRLEAKAAAALDADGDGEGSGKEEGAERPVVTALEYVDQDGSRVLVADEEDWAVCLADLVGNKLS
ncbi:hypothetical protein HK405_006652, partial [Cladochytrium tenue]